MGRFNTSGGVKAFTSLSDVPAAYTGKALEYLRVNAAELALEFNYMAQGGGKADLTITKDLDDDKYIGEGKLRTALNKSYSRSDFNDLVDLLKASAPDYILNLGGGGYRGTPVEPYIVTDQLLIDYDNIAIHGSGMGNTVLKAVDGLNAD